MSRIIITVFTLIFLFMADIFGQTFKNIADRTYINKDGVWYISPLDKEGEYPVNTKSITVKLNEGLSIAVLDEQIRNTGIVIERQNKLGFIDLKLPEQADCFQIAEKFGNSGYFENIEINSFGKTFGTDPGYSSQYYLHNTTYNLSGYGYLDIDATYSQTWSIEDGSSNQVTVAVLDLGVATGHSDLLISANGYDFEADDDDPNPESTDHHGTSVAGIIAAKTYNSYAIAGISGGYNSDGTKIMALRVGDGVNHNWWEGAITSSVVDDAIIYAADNGAKIINMSFGCTQSSAINSAIHYAYAYKGCLLIAATGNDGGVGDFGYPASNTYVMAVGGINQSWQPYGNWDGPLEVVAPATNIVTLNNTGYANMGSGTSYAAPQAAGIAALLFSYDPSILHIDARKLINMTALNLDGIDSEKFGNGLMKAGNVIGVLANPGLWTYPEPPQISITAQHGQHPVISWSKVDNDFDYYVYRSHSEDGRYNFVYKATVDYVYGQSNYSWTDNNITASRFGAYDYYYRVTSCWEGLESVLSNEVSCKSNQTQKKDIITTTVTPQRFALEQNYPNPFNPETKISFSVAEDAQTSLVIYNAAGQLIKTIADSYYTQGVHEVIFNAGNLASGVYYCKLTSGKNTAIKKMLLVR